MDGEGVLRWYIPFHDAHDAAADDKNGYIESDDEFNRETEPSNVPPPSLSTVPTPRPPPDGKQKRKSRKEHTTGRKAHKRQEPLLLEDRYIIKPRNIVAHASSLAPVLKTLHSTPGVRLVYKGFDKGSLNTDSYFDRNQAADDYIRESDINSPSGDETGEKEGGGFDHGVVHKIVEAFEVMKVHAMRRGMKITSKQIKRSVDKMAEVRPRLPAPTAYMHNESTTKLISGNGASRGDAPRPPHKSPTHHHYYTPHTDAHKKSPAEDPVESGGPINRPYPPHHHRHLEHQPAPSDDAVADSCTEDEGEDFNESNNAATDGQDIGGEYYHSQEGDNDVPENSEAMSNPPAGVPEDEEGNYEEDNDETDFFDSSFVEDKFSPRDRPVVESTTNDEGKERGASNRSPQGFHHYYMAMIEMGEFEKFDTRGGQRNRESIHVEPGRRKSKYFVPVGEASSTDYSILKCHALNPNGKEDIISVEIGKDAYLARYYNEDRKEYDEQDLELYSFMEPPLLDQEILLGKIEDRRTAIIKDCKALSTSKHFHKQRVMSPSGKHHYLEVIRKSKESSDEILIDESGKLYSDEDLGRVHVVLQPGPETLARINRIARQRVELNRQNNLNLKSLPKVQEFSNQITKKFRNKRREGNVGCTLPARKPKHRDSLMEIREELGGTSFRVVDDYLMQNNKGEIPLKRQSLKKTAGSFYVGSGAKVFGKSGSRSSRASKTLASSQAVLDGMAEAGDNPDEPSLSGGDEDDFDVIDFVRVEVANKKRRESSVVRKRTSIFRSSDQSQDAFPSSGGGPSFAFKNAPLATIPSAGSAALVSPRGSSSTTSMSISSPHGSMSVNTMADGPLEGNNPASAKRTSMSNNRMSISSGTLLNSDPSRRTSVARRPSKMKRASILSTGLPPGKRNSVVMSNIGLQLTKRKSSVLDNSNFSLLHPPKVSGRKGSKESVWSRDSRESRVSIFDGVDDRPLKYEGNGPLLSNRGMPFVPHQTASPRSMSGGGSSSFIMPSRAAGIEKQSLRPRIFSAGDDSEDVPLTPHAFHGTKIFDSTRYNSTNYYGSSPVAADRKQSSVQIGPSFSSLFKAERPIAPTKSFIKVRNDGSIDEQTVIAEAQRPTEFAPPRKGSIVLDSSTENPEPSPHKVKGETAAAHSPQLSTKTSFLLCDDNASERRPSMSAKSLEEIRSVATILMSASTTGTTSKPSANKDAESQVTEKEGYNSAAPLSERKRTSTVQSPRASGRDLSSFQLGGKGLSSPRSSASAASSPRASVSSPRSPSRVYARPIIKPNRKVEEEVAEETARKESVTDSSRKSSMNESSRKSSVMGSRKQSNISRRSSNTGRKSSVTSRRNRKASRFGEDNSFRAQMSNDEEFFEDNAEDNADGTSVTFGHGKGTVTKEKSAVLQMMIGNPDTQLDDDALEGMFGKRPKPLKKEKGSFHVSSILPHSRGSVGNIFAGLVSGNALSKLGTDDDEA